MHSLAAVRVVGYSAVLIGASAFVTASAVAQDSEHDWQKIYQVSAHPSLALETGDLAVEVLPCGNCTTVHVSVHTERKLSEFEIDEHQEGNRVTFRIKERPSIGFHVNWHGSGRNFSRVTVETPANLSLEARVADGSITAHGLTGEFQLHSSDGSVTLDDVHGTINARTADGSVHVHHSSGELEARSSDGSVDAEGKFSKVALHTSDGSVRFSLAEGSQLTSASTIESSDGGVSIRLPQTLAADLDVQARDGSIKCSLPLKMDGYNSKGSSDHHIAGHLNAGGTPLAVRTSDGSVTIAAL